MKIRLLFNCTIAIVLTLTACKTEGCTDLIAENYSTEAEKSDASCTYFSDKFIGTYEVVQECVDGDNPSYTIEIVAGANKEEIKIQNFYNVIDLTAAVDELSISYKGSILGNTYEGTGYLAGDALTFTYVVCETVLYPCLGTEPCIMICLK